MLSSLFVVVQDIHCCIMSLGYERGGVVKILVKCVCMGGGWLSKLVGLIQSREGIKT